MLKIEDYFGVWAGCADVTPEVRTNAAKLITACNKLMQLAEADRVVFKQNPTTKSVISGTTLGGFRPQDCKIGAAKSSHKQGLAVDLYDPSEQIDNWCMKNLDLLKQCGIYIEHPSATKSWSHWTIKAPGSGNRVFYP